MQFGELFVDDWSKLFYIEVVVLFLFYLDVGLGDICLEDSERAVYFELAEDRCNIVLIRIQRTEVKDSHIFLLFSKFFISFFGDKILK